MSFKIYTKTGDKGKTGLIGGTKVLKSDIRIEAYGTVDELNSYVGLIGDQINDEHSKEILKLVQDRLFTIGSSLATDRSKEVKMKLPEILEDDVVLLEKEIDKMDEVLQPMKSFILPGGHVTVSTIHIARCVCRRAERCCVGMENASLEVEPLVIKYLNRLSDYLFTLARYVAHQLGIKDVEWKPK